MEVLVQKFGGTSVASYEKMKEVCKIIEAHKENLKKAEETLKKRFPDMKIKKRLMHKDGSVEKI